jgi:hypothetical protein
LEKQLHAFFLSTVLIVLVSSTFSVQIIAKPVSCPRLENECIIDGKWSYAEEWSDALEKSLNFVVGEGEAYFRIKHDNDYVYFLVDFVSDSKPQVQDLAAILLDTENDGGEMLQKDDLIVMLMFQTPRKAVSAIAWGTGKDRIEQFPEKQFQPYPEDFEMAVMNVASEDPHSLDPHMVYEFQIPKSYLKSDIVKFYVMVASDSSKNTACYPVVDANMVDSWAELEFSDKTLEELTKPPPTPTPTPTKTPTLTSTPTETLTPIPPPTPILTEVSKEASTVTVTRALSVQIPGGYLTIVSIIAAVTVILAVALILKKKTSLSQSFLRIRM